MQESLAGTGAIHLRRIVQIARHRLQRRQEKDHVDAEVMPDRDAGHGPEGGFPFAEEGDRAVDDAEVHQELLNGAPGRGEKKKVKASETTAMLVITGMNPMVRNATTPADAGVQDHRQHQRQRQLDHNLDAGVEQGVPDCAPPEVILHQPRVVIEPTNWRARADFDAIPIQQRGVEDIADRERHEDQEEDDGRRTHQVGGAMALPERFALVCPAYPGVAHG